MCFISIQLEHVRVFGKLNRTDFNENERKKHNNENIVIGNMKRPNGDSQICDLEKLEKMAIIPSTAYKLNQDGAEALQIKNWGAETVFFLFFFVAYDSANRRFVTNK